MSSTKQWVWGVILVLTAGRLAWACFRSTLPSSPAVMAEGPEAVSDREARKSEERARFAEVLEASTLDLEAREKLDEARRDSGRALRDLSQEANRSGATKLGLAAMDLERELLKDARRTCSLDALKGVDEATSTLSPGARTALAERLSVVHRHVTRTCELATK